MKNPLLKAYIAWAMVCFFWGTTYLAIRVGVATFPPALFAGIRFAIAGLAFLFFLRLRGYIFPSWREVADQAVVGVALLVVANGTVVWCEQWVPSGITALIVATVPFWMAGFDALLSSGDCLTSRIPNFVQACLQMVMACLRMANPPCKVITFCSCKNMRALSIAGKIFLLAHSV